VTSRRQSCDACKKIGRFCDGCRAIRDKAGLPEHPYCKGCWDGGTTESIAGTERSCTYCNGLGSALEKAFKDGFEKGRERGREAVMSGGQSEERFQGVPDISEIQGL